MHLQHFCQNIARKNNSKFCLHLASLAYDENYRAKDNISKHITGNTIHQVLNQGGVCTTVSNFRPACKFLYSVYPDHVNLEDSVRYKDIDLVVNNHKPFDSLTHLGEI